MCQRDPQHDLVRDQLIHEWPHSKRTFLTEEYGEVTILFDPAWAVAAVLVWDCGRAILPGHVVRALMEARSVLPVRKNPGRTTPEDRPSPS